MIALYEGEKQKADKLSERLKESEDKVAALSAQIVELSRQIDNMQLSQAFMASGDSSQARARIEKLIREIDKCIKQLEK
ncbi:MAG: hypothetical protein J5764_04890 [Bacteroidales bacterium]|nr:hypothetical protein [Bacteroidales bacterium]